MITDPGMLDLITLKRGSGIYWRRLFDFSHCPKNKGFYRRILQNVNVKAKIEGRIEKPYLVVNNLNIINSHGKICFIKNIANFNNISVLFTPKSRMDRLKLIYRSPNKILMKGLIFCNCRQNIIKKLWSKVKSSLI